MSQYRFNPWLFAGDLVVANMQAGVGFWHRLSSTQGDAARSRAAERVAARASGGFEARQAALHPSPDLAPDEMPAERPAGASAEPGAAGPKPESVKGSAKRGGKRRPRK